jgi:superkiller protein 3
MRSEQSRITGATRSALVPALVGVAILQVGPALAQPAFETKHGFVAGLVELVEALKGTYGDEGIRVRSALDAMDKALSQWDATLQAYATAVRSQLEGASAPVAAAMHVPLGAVYLERGWLDEALAELETASRLDPERADVHVFRGLAYDAANRRHEAREAFGRAWELDSGDPAKAYWLIGHSPSFDEAPEARRALESLLDHERRRPPGRAPTAPFLQVTLVDDAYSLNPVFPPARYADAFALLAEHRYEEALAGFREAAAADPLLQDPALRLEPVAQGTRALRNGRVKVAIERFKGAAESSPGSSEVRRLLGTAHWFDQQYDDAVDALEQAVRLNPRDERVRLVLAEVLGEAGRFAEAEQVLRDTIGVMPRSGSARWTLGRIYRAQGRDGEALREFQGASGAFVGAGRLQAIVSRLAAGQFDVDAAVEAARRWVGLDPNAADAHQALGDAYRRQERADEALAEFLMAALLDPENGVAQAAVGQLHLAAGRHADAVAALQKAVALNPTNKEAHYALASTLIRLGRTGEATAELETFRRLQAETVERERRTYELNQLQREAVLRDGEGRYEQSAALWQQIVDAEPDAAASHVGLARVLVKAGRREAAVEHFVTALALDAGSDVHRDLAELYAALGRLDESHSERETYERLKQERLRKRGTGQ